MGTDHPATLMHEGKKNKKKTGQAYYTVTQARQTHRRNVVQGDRSSIMGHEFGLQILDVC